MTNINFLYCHSCGKCVSSGFIPIPTDTPDKGLVVRAYIECPECIEKKDSSSKKSDQHSASILYEENKRPRGDMGQ